MSDFKICPAFGQGEKNCTNNTLCTGELLPPTLWEKDIYSIFIYSIYSIITTANGRSLREGSRMMFIRNSVYV